METPKNVIELLSALVQIPSVNPDGNPGVDMPGEQACAEAVGAFLQAAGAVVEYQQVLPGRPNVIGRFPTDRPGKKRVIFAPHTDTVSVVGMAIDPFSGDVRDGKLWGRGASDTKGTMAAMLWALWEMRDRLATLEHEIWFVGLMGEEAGQNGSKAFVKEYCSEAPERSFAVIGEPTGPTIVHASKGVCWLNLKTHGVAAHASTPERGENAIYKMLEVIYYLREVLAPRWAAVENPVLGTTTMSVGAIQGGIKTNIVPDFCEAAIDIRMVPELFRSLEGSFAEAVLAELRETVDPGLQATWRESAPLWTDPEHPLIALLERCGMTRGGAPWFCDGAIFSAAGVPAVAAGPGSIAQAHTKDEHISIDDLVGGVKFYTTFLQQL